MSVIVLTWFSTCQDLEWIRRQASGYEVKEYFDWVNPGGNNSSKRWMAPIPWLERKKLKHSLISTSWLQMQYDQVLQAPDVGLFIISPSFCKLLLPTYFITTTARGCNSSSLWMFIAAHLSSLFQLCVILGSASIDSFFSCLCVSFSGHIFNLW